MLWRYNFKLAWLSLCKTPVLSLLMMSALGVGIAGCLVTLTIQVMMTNNPVKHKNDNLFAVQLDAWSPEYSFDSFNDMPLQLTYQDAVALHTSLIPTRSVIMCRTSFVIQAKNSELVPKFAVARMTSSDFFTMFDVPFLYGAAWDSAADRSTARVVVLSKQINDLFFGGRDSVGETLYMNGADFTIVGVLEDWWPIPKVYDPTIHEFSRPAKVYAPFSLTPVFQPTPEGRVNSWSTQAPNPYRDYLNNETTWLQMWVELPTEEHRRTFAGYIESYIEAQQQQGRFQRPLHYALNKPSDWLLINQIVHKDNGLIISLSILFLIVCQANTVVMLLAKFLCKVQETSVRRALGASRQSIFSQYLLEATLIVIGGGVLGLVLTWLGLAGFRALNRYYQFITLLHWQTFAMALGFTFLICLVCGALPALRASRTQPARYLNTQ